MDSFSVFRFADVVLPELVVHHVGEMMGGFSTKKQRAGLVKCLDMVDLVDWLSSVWQIGRVDDI